MSDSNITIQQGATFLQEWEILDRTEEPFETEGYTGSSQMRKSWTSNTAFNFVVSLSYGKLTLSMDSSVTGGIAPGSYVFDVYMSNGPDKEYRVIEGNVAVTPQITRL